MGLIISILTFRCYITAVRHTWSAEGHLSVERQQIWRRDGVQGFLHDGSQVRWMIYPSLSFLHLPSWFSAAMLPASCSLYTHPAVQRGPGHSGQSVLLTAAALSSAVSKETSPERSEWSSVLLWSHSAERSTRRSSRFTTAVSDYDLNLIQIGSYVYVVIYWYQFQY